MDQPQDRCIPLLCLVCTGEPLLNVWQTDSDIYYPAASGTLKSIPGDWTSKPWYGAPANFLIFSTIWIVAVRFGGIFRGVRVASLTTAFVMAPFWIVSVISSDLYNLEINWLWLVSMGYSNITFILFGFVGKGQPDDLGF